MLASKTALILDLYESTKFQALYIFHLHKEIVKKKQTKEQAEQTATFHDIVVNYLQKRYVEVRI